MKKNYLIISVILISSGFGISLIEPAVLLKSLLCGLGVLALSGIVVLVRKRHARTMPRWN